METFHTREMKAHSSNENTTLLETRITNVGAFTFIWLQEIQTCGRSMDGEIKYCLYLLSLRYVPWYTAHFAFHLHLQTKC